MNRQALAEAQEAGKPMHSNTELITRFYQAFGRRDPNDMAACYHPAVEFSDPVFPDLKGERAVAMWRMLCARGKDLRIEFGDVEADDTSGRAHWEAWYTFSATGRKVHNRINARFEFRDGRIIRHCDTFSFWAWARQALGPAGGMLGWSGLLRNRVRQQAARSLTRYLAP
jgi:ketosteroid isomerase-like protein